MKRGHGKVEGENAESFYVCLRGVWSWSEMGDERRGSLGVQEEGDPELPLRSWKKRPTSSWMYKQRTPTLLKPHESITCQEGGCWPY